MSAHPLINSVHGIGLAERRDESSLLVEPSVGGIKLDAVSSVGILRLETFVWDHSFKNVRFGTFALDLSLGNFRLIAFVWDHSFVNFRFGTFALGLSLWNLRLA